MSADLTRRRVVAAMFVVAGVIHLVPLSGLLGADRLAALYALPMTDPNLAILMRHRAVLFGLLGSFLVYAAFRPDLQPVAFAAGFVSVISFLVLAWSTGGHNDAVTRIVNGDIVALIALVIGLALYLRRER